MTRVPHTDDPRDDALFKKYRWAVTGDEQEDVTEEVPRDKAETKLGVTLSDCPIIQANRATVQGYPHLRDMKVLCETTWHHT